MSQGDVNFVPDWKSIAVLTAAEADPDKVLDLAKELIRALDHESNRSLENLNPESKQEPA
jgi:hypothetical protein